MKSIACLLSAVALCAIAPVASASPHAVIATPATIATVDQPGAVCAVEQRERGDLLRIAYHADQARRARHDLAIAELTIDATRVKWDDAVAHGHPNSAGFWAQRHAAALAAERDADGRWLDERAEREFARADLQHDSDRLRRLTVASRGVP